MCCCWFSLNMCACALTSTRSCACVFVRIAEDNMCATREAQSGPIYAHSTRGVSGLAGPHVGGCTRAVRKLETTTYTCATCLARLPTGPFARSKTAMRGLHSRNLHTHTNTTQHPVLFCFPSVRMHISVLRGATRMCKIHARSHN